MYLSLLRHKVRRQLSQACERERGKREGESCVHPVHGLRVRGTCKRSCRWPTADGRRATQAYVTALSVRSRQANRLLGSCSCSAHREPLFVDCCCSCSSASVSETTAPELEPDLKREVKRRTSLPHSSCLLLSCCCCCVPSSPLTATRYVLSRCLLRPPAQPRLPAP